MSDMASQITGVPFVCSTVCSDADQRKHQSFASLTFVMGIHGDPIDSPHKRPVTRKLIPKNVSFGMYRQTSNLRRNLVGNKIVDHSDVLSI